MSRKRKIKQRLDLRKGGLANRHKLQEGGISIDEARENFKAKQQQQLAEAFGDDFEVSTRKIINN